MDIFNAVKSAVTLSEHMQHACGCTIEKAGTALRANPCPFCHHSDCMTLVAASNYTTYKCFSCDKTGDVITLERDLNGHAGNLEAAQALAERYKITTDGPATPPGKPARTSAPPPPAAKKPAGADLPPIDPDRAAALRRIMADHFQAALVASPDAMEYQTKKRGHSPELLAHHRVGYITGDNIVAVAADAGYTTEELHAICLLRKRGKGYGPYIPNGLYVYPHFAGDRVLHFTIKDPSKTHKFQLKKAGADPAWLCYGQDALAADSEIWLVEGEDDRLTLMERGGIDTAVAIIGNSATPYLLEWIGLNAAGKTFVLCFDPDDAGRKYTARLGTGLLNSGATVHAIDLDKYGDDIDALLRTASDPAALVAEIRASATALEKRPDDDSPLSYEFASFDVLGEAANGDIIFWSAVHNRTYPVSINDLSLDFLCRVGSWEVRSRVSRKDTEGMIKFTSLKTYLIVKAAHSYLGTLKILGQGIHLLRDGRLLIVNGDEAVTWDGRRFDTQQHPIIDRQFIQWEADLRWCDLAAVQKQVLAMRRETAEQIFDDLMNLVAQWRFTGGLDHFVLAGWMLAQVVQTAWEWRPQLWMSGSSGSGKTMLSLLIEALGGSLVCRFEGNSLSEPGWRQTMQHHAWMAIIDEFEESQHRDRIIDRLRSAGRGGKGALGSSRQEAVSFHIRHMVLIASIETGLVRAAEQYRYLQISTKKDNTRQPTIPSPAECEAMQTRMIAYALWAVYPAKEMIRNLKQIPGYDNRWVHSVAVPMAMFAAMDAKPATVFANAIADYLAEWSATQEGGIQEDESALLTDIMLAAVRLAEVQTDGFNDKTVYAERTVSQVLEHLPPTMDQHNTLQAYGVRYLDDEADALFLYPDTIAKKLLKNTRWRDLNLRDILLRCPGAARARKRLAGTQVRGILLPVETWRTIT